MFFLKVVFGLCLGVVLTVVGLPWWLVGLLVVWIALNNLNKEK